MKADLVSQGVFNEGATVGTWTRKSITINYITTDIPDTLVFIASSSAAMYGVAGPFRLGSTLYLDDIRIDFGVGIATPLSDLINPYYAYPTEGAMNIVVKDPSNVTTVTVYDISGKLMTTVPVTGATTVVNTSEFAKGVYIYRISNREQVLWNNKFPVME
jgi:hypothetical protein